MARATHTQTNFTGGILTGKMLGRSDISKYGNGAQRLDNALVFPQGGVSKRPGTKYIARVRGSNPARLLRFQFNDEEAYVIEMTGGYFRFYRDGGLVTTTQAAATIASVSGTVYLVTVASPHHLAVGDQVTIAGSTPSDYDGTYTVLLTPSTTTFRVDIGSNPGAYTGGSGTVTLPYSVEHPYAEADIEDVRYTQSADVLYLAHPRYIPRLLSRTGADVFGLDTLQFDGGPFGNVQPSTITLTNSGGTYTVGASVTVTASAALWDNVNNSDLGRMVRMQHGGTWGYGIITGISSATVATIYVLGATAAGAASAYQLGYWRGAIDSDAASTTTLTNEGTEYAFFPSTVAFHQQRLWYANVPGDSQLIMSSVTGDFIQFKPSEPDGTVLDTDGMTYTIATNQVNAVYWMRSSAKGLMIGTVGEEHMLRSSSAFEPITPTNVKAEVQTAHGSKSTVRPVQVGSVVLFAQRIGEKLREFAFQFERDQYVSIDLTILAEELGKKGIRYMAYQEEPSSIVWCVCDDGDLILLTYQRDQEVVAWTKATLYNGEAESVEVTPETTDDVVWLVVKRTIDGNVVRYVEAIQSQFDVGDDQDLAWFVDSGLSYNGRNTDTADFLTVTGAGYAENDSVVLSATGHAPFTGTSADVNKRFRLYDGLSIYDVQITAQDTTTSCTAKLLNDVPASLQATATSEWAALTNSLSGLDHLEGEGISLLVDGGTHPSRTVSSGAVSLQSYAAKVVAGLGYTMTVKTLPIRTVQFSSDARGKFSHLYACSLNLWNSLGGAYQLENKHVYDISYRIPSDALGIPPRVQSTVVEHRLGGSYDYTPVMQVISSDPLPFTLLAVIYELDINDPV